MVTMLEEKSWTLTFPPMGTCVHNTSQRMANKIVAEEETKFRVDMFCPEIIFFGEDQSNHVIWTVCGRLTAHLSGY